MPRGITQEQVNTTADAILQAGERATVERVRERLGTGSPNTITRMLDTWRLDLAERLRAVNATPALPDDVGEAMTQLWQLAVEQARMQEHRALEGERLALEKARNDWEATVQEAQQAQSTAEAQATQALEAKHRASEQVTVLERLVQQLENQLSERSEALQAAQDHIETLNQTRETLTEKIAQWQQQADTERTAQEAHIRQVEDRAHLRVDQARTDLKEARTEWARLRKRYEKEQAATAGQINALTQALAKAEAEANRQRGKAEALAQQLRSSSKPPRKQAKAKPQAVRKRTKATASSRS